MQHAHRRGVIHRDIKPSNLIVDHGASTDTPRLRILDFGLARLEGQETLTLSGDVVGTPQYMSPEQARRRKVPVDHRSDIWSLGATIYEAICGEPPFRGRDHADTLSRIIERDPIEPRKRNPRVPKDLETIVLKCLRKDAVDRYGTAEALGQDLRRFVRGDAIEARPPSRVERVLRRLRAHRIAIATGVAFVLLASISGVLYLRTERSEQASRAAEARTLLLDLAAILTREEFVLDASLAARSQGLRLPAGTLAPIDDDALERLVLCRALDDVARAADRLEQLRAAVSDRRDLRDLCYQLARARSALGDERAARNAARDSLRLDPGFAPASVLLARIERVSDTPNETEALATEPTEPPRWGVLWHEAQKVLANAKQSKETALRRALDALDELIPIARDAELYAGAEYELRLWRGVARLELGDSERAKHDFIVAQRLAPRAAIEPALLLAKAYLDGDESSRGIADELFEELLAATPPERHDENRLWFVSVYRAVHDTSGALRWAGRIEDRALNARLRAFLHHRERSWADALSAAREAIGADPSSLNAHQLALAASIEALPRGPPYDCERAVELLELLASTLQLDAANDYSDFLRRVAAARLESWLARERTQPMYAIPSCSRRLLTLATTLFAGITFAQEPILDDFVADPDPFDGDPMMWVSVANPCCRVEVQDGGERGICLQSIADRYSSGLVSEEVFAGDVTLQVQVTHWTWKAGVAIHFDGDAINGYLARTGDDGNVWLRRFDSGQANLAIPQPAPGITVGEELILELRSVGERLEFRAWSPQDERPTDALIELSDDTYRSGRVGLAGWPAPNEQCYAWARIIPEPIDPPPTTRFRRGDCNDDGAIDLSDAVTDLQHCFSGGPIPCAAACDTDDDGNPCSGVTDAVLMLNYLFLGGPAPSAPFSACGPLDESDAACETPPENCAAE